MDEKKKVKLSSAKIIPRRPEGAINPIKIRELLAAMECDFESIECIFFRFCNFLIN